MKLTFHDTHEFESFARVYMAGVAARDKPTVIGELAVNLTLDEAAFAGVVADITAHMRDEPAGDEPEALGNGDPDPQPANDDGIVHERIDLPPADETEQEVEKPKRKRRTKAEIEAAALAEQRTLDPVDEADPLKEAYRTIVHGPRESDTVQEPGTNEREPGIEAKGAAGETPKHQASTESLEKHAAAQAEYTPELIETLKGQAELFDANRTAHLNEGREAIAKHGFIKYMATFKGLGLDSAIATYNDEQVKLHRAAVAHLMAT